MIRYSAGSLAIIMIVSCGFFENSLQKSNPGSDSYVAAVLEYNSIRGEGAFLKNLENYLKFITEAANKSADIIVFPESTIIGASAFRVPNPADKVKLCNLQNHGYDDFLVQLSCAAFKSSIYLVLNIEEKFDCTSLEDDICEKAQEYIFNTNIVFDRDGALIDRYRKINLFGEFDRTPSKDRALGVFDTDFGVKFGHFICFDFIFQTPAIDILEKEKVKNIIFTETWLSELPYLTAVQFQEGYAYANDINLLAAGGNDPMSGNTGSGIFSGKSGAIVSIMSGVNQTRLLIAKVPKIPGNVMTGEDSHIRPNSAVEMDGLRLEQDDVTVYKSQLIEEITKPQVINLAYGDTECTFEIKLAEVTLNETKQARYRFRALTFDGVRSLDDFGTGGVVLCSVTACSDDTLASCGRRFDIHSVLSDEQITFESVNIILTMPSSYMASSNGMVVPSAVDIAFRPLFVNKYRFEKSEDGFRDTYKMSSRSRLEFFYSFGIWGRIFNRDGEPETLLSY